MKAAGEGNHYVKATPPPSLELFGASGWPVVARPLISARQGLEPPRGSDHSTKASGGSLPKPQTNPSSASWICLWDLREFPFMAPGCQAGPASTQVGCVFCTVLLLYKI